MIESQELSCHLGFVTVYVYANVWYLNVILSYLDHTYFYFFMIYLKYRLLNLPHSAVFIPPRNRSINPVGWRDSSYFV